MTTTQTTNLAGLQARMRTSSPPGWPPTGSPWSPLLVAPRAGAPADKIGSRPPMFLDLAMQGAGLIWSALSAASAPVIEFEHTDHPLAVEQRTGITMARVREIAATLLHPPS